MIGHQHTPEWVLYGFCVGLVVALVFFLGDQVEPREVRDLQPLPTSPTTAPPVMVPLTVAPAVETEVGG